MNYQIIKNESVLKYFIGWLPDLKPNETYYVSLLARKKYNPSIKIDKVQLKRFTSKKENLFDKIKQLECQIGSFTTKGEPIPQDSLALYISVNPRDLEMATKNALKTMIDKIVNPYDGYNPHQLVLTEIHKACCKNKPFMDFDFDNVPLENIVDKITFNRSAYHILQTRGGFHILVELEKLQPEFKKSWYNTMANIEGCDVKGDNLIPVPGCTQGEFIPDFII